MKALVTGGSGFIGSHISRKLLLMGAEVVIVDNLRTGFIENNPPGAKFIHVGIDTDNWTSHLPDDITHVFHLAAQSSGEISYEDPQYDLCTNALGTLSLLKWSLEHRIEKFIFTSSMNVYGQVEDTSIDESYPVRPDSFYAVGKLASEHYIRIFSELGLNSVVLRLFNVYGPGQNMNNLRQGMLSIYLAFMTKNKPIVVKGSLERFRDFVYIDDVVNAIELAINYDKNFEIFNVCSGVKTTVQQAIDQLVKSYGLTEYPIEVVEGTHRDQFGIYGDNSKINKLMGWSPKYDLNKGLTNFINWVKETKNK